MKCNIVYDAENDHQQNGTFLMVALVLLHSITVTLNLVYDARNGHHQSGTFLVDSQML